VIAEHKAKIVIMYSGRTTPHGEVYSPQKDIVEHIKYFFDDRITEAKRYGVSESQIILDCGMGAFLSKSSSLSWDLLKRLDEIAVLGFPLMIGASRKRFLRDVSPLTSRHMSLSQRDSLSAVLALHLFEKLQNISSRLLFRVHDVHTHVLMFKMANQLRGTQEMLSGSDRSTLTQPYGG
jgi:dihydropteroate synthase